MSDDKSDRKSNTLSQVSKWIIGGGIVALLGGIATTVGYIDTISDQLSSIIGKQDTLDKYGKFEVNADEQRGEPFTNEYSSTKEYQFFATGKWSYTEDLINGPGGHPDHREATDNYKLPDYPEGALIMRREDGSYELIGSEKKLTLEKGERVFFTINDATDSGPSTLESYSDNSGTLTVEWDCTTCK